MNSFCIANDSFVPAQAAYWESIFTLSNSAFGLRGMEDEGGVHPGFFLAGLFDRSECLVPEIVNFPDLLPVWVECEGERFTTETAEVGAYHRQLDMRKGVLERSVRFKSASGKLCSVRSRRFASFHDVNCLAVEYRFVCENFSGPVLVRSSFDAGRPSREGSYDYNEAVKHYVLDRFNDQFEENFRARIVLRDDRMPVVFASHLGVSGPAFRRGRSIHGEKCVETLELEVSAGREVVVRKYAVVADGRTVRPDALDEFAECKLERMKCAGFDTELEHSSFVLSKRWESADVGIEGDDEVQRMLRFNIYQLLGLGALHSPAFSIGAKGLSTERYGGHYFWDTEIYVFPFFLNSCPAIARNLLEFRSRTLDAARTHAASLGFDGCLWPWQSSARGEEGIRQTVLPDGRVLRRAILDQYHIVSDVAFACFQYLRHTGDEFFFRSRLIPIVVESMRFWRSFILRQNDAGADVYHLRRVMGPDEYHANVDDNYFTNLATHSLFSEFFAYYDGASPKQRYDVARWTRLQPGELDAFRAIARKIYLAPLPDGVIEQFDGYFALTDIPITRLGASGLPEYPDVSVGAGLPDSERQDALQAHATSTQLIKQADAVLSIALWPGRFTDDQIKSTFAYYDRRTLHFSSLSPGACAIVAARAGAVQRAYELYRLGVAMDLRDVKSETKTGLHTACHGGAYLGAINGFAGVRIAGETVVIGPRLPDHWKALTFRLCFRGSQLEVRCSRAQTSVRLVAGEPQNVTVGGDTRRVETNETFSSCRNQPTPASIS